MSGSSSFDDSAGGSALYNMFRGTWLGSLKLAAAQDDSARSDNGAVGTPSISGLASFYNQTKGSPIAMQGVGGFDPNCNCAAMYCRPGFRVGDTVHVQMQNDPSRSVDVLVNDTGPFLADKAGNPVVPLKPHPSRVIDLTPKAMQDLVGPNYKDIGLVPVTVTRKPKQSG